MEQRVIKFRAWDIGTQTWIYFGVDGIPASRADRIDNGLIHQFTGLPDKNGKEIYEGDIVEVDGSGLYGGNEKYKGTFEIEVVLSAWGHEYNWKPIRGYSCSTHIMSDEENRMIPNACVIGNIYEPAKDPQP